MSPSRGRAFLSLALLSAAGCNSNPEGPRVPRQYEADAVKAAPEGPPLPKKGPDNPRGLQYARPD